MTLDYLLGVALTNAATATLLGAGVALASRWIKRPALVHALWLLVFCDLLAPPILKVGLLPGKAGGLGRESTPEASAVGTGVVSRGAPLAAGAMEHATLRNAAAPLTVRRPGTSESDHGGARAGRLRNLMAALWLGGPLVVLLLGARKLLLFRHRLRGAVEAPVSMRDRASILAGVIGLRRTPRICLARSRISPLLWFRRWRLEILLPEPLLASLRAPEIDALLLHELAHVKRRDHWVRVLEFCASAVFWWHPLVSWARGRMRQAEEQACDAWVLSCAPGRGSDYATGLLKTVEFLAGARPRSPVLAQGLGTYRLIEERLTMILDDQTPKRMSRLQTATLVGLAGVLLLAFPTRAARSSTIRASEPAATVAASSAPREVTRAAIVTATIAPVAGTPAPSIAASSKPSSDEEKSTASAADRIVRLEREIERLARELEEARGQHASRDALEQYREAIGEKVRSQADYEAAIAAQPEVERQSQELNRARREMMEKQRQDLIYEEEGPDYLLYLKRPADEKGGQSQNEIGSQLLRMRGALSQLGAAIERLSAEQNELRRGIETLEQELERLRAK